LSRRLAALPGMRAFRTVSGHYLSLDEVVPGFGLPMMQSRESIGVIQTNLTLLSIGLLDATVIDVVICYTRPREKGSYSSSSDKSNTKS
jgi:hypothetical protein